MLLRGCKANGARAKAYRAPLKVFIQFWYSSEREKDRREDRNEKVKVKVKETLMENEHGHDLSGSTSRGLCTPG